MSRTLLICKPDAVERGLVGQIIDRIERKGLRLLTGSLRVITEAEASEHYVEHVARPFYADLVSFITRSPSFLCVVEGPEETWKIVRTLMGPTNPAEAPPGTIRGDFGTEVGENLVHGSDAETSAQREIKLFFPDLV
ncbi:MAG TPA: nucleoside-diphosphate kinase [Acidimicrobiales bacterium]